MRRLLLTALVLALAGGAASTAEAQQKKSGKASTAECTMLIGPFRGKKNADVKDEQVAEYAPLMTSYWKKRCPVKLYEEEVQDPELRKRIDAAAPRPSKRTKKQA